MPRIILILFCILALNACATLTEPGRIYHGAVCDIRDKNLNPAFMELRFLIRDYPKTPYAKDARFAIAEYFFIKNDYYDALREFAAIQEDFPNSPHALFAKAVAYKIISQHGRKDIKELSSKIKKEFFDKPVVLVFSEYKTKSLKTLWGSCYAIKDYVDRVEILKDNEIFLKITP
ncbi:MAG: hypothetical protein V1674_01560 [Candidatus Omnitrophota bacterium]